MEIQKNDFPKRFSAREMDMSTFTQTKPIWFGCFWTHMYKS